MSALWSFICKVTNHNITFDLQQFALRKHVSRRFAIVWVLYRTAISPPCLSCLSSLFFSSSLQKVPPAKATQSVVPPVEYFAQASSTQAQLARFRLLLSGPSPIQLPHPLNSTAVCCWRTSPPLLSACAVLRHPLRWFINISVTVLANVHEASGSCVQTPSLP